jgi:hypothetical protein
MEIGPVVIGSVFTLLGAGVFFYGFNRMHKYRLIADTPTSKIRSIAMGIVEIVGNVLAKDKIKTPFSHTDCVYYKYEIKEYRRHTSTSNGKTRTTYRWDTVANGSRRTGFFVKDDTGTVWTEPTGAEFNVGLKKLYYQRRGVFGAFNTIVNALKNWDNKKEMGVDIGKWGLTEMDPKKSSFRASMVGDRKYYEYFIEPDEKTYVLGTAANYQGKVFIKQGENEKTFIISDKSEKGLLKNLKWTMIGCFVLGGIFVVVGIIVLLKIFGVI